MAVVGFGVWVYKNRAINPRYNGELILHEYNPATDKFDQLHRWGEATFKTYADCIAWGDHVKVRDEPVLRDRGFLTIACVYTEG